MGHADATQAPGRRLAAIMVAALVLSWPAFWNGYPLVFTDSASFIGALNPAGQHWARPIFYSWALWPLHWGVTLWPVVIAQGAVLAHLLWLVLRALAGRVELPAYGVVVLLVAAGSALPWYTAQIMPDVLAPILVLAVFLLGFCADRLTRLEAVWPFLLLCGAIASHMSHIPLAGGLLIGVAVIRLLRDGAGAMRAAVPVGAALLLAVAAHVGVNAVFLGKPTLSPFGSIFLLARSQMDGPATWHLREACPEAGWRLCADVDRLPMHHDTFLWDRQGPFWRAAGLDDERRQQAAGMTYQTEAAAIMAGTLDRYAVEQLAVMLENAARQVFQARTGDGLLSWSETQGVSRAIAGEVPLDYAAYRDSRQIADTLGLETVNRVHGWVLPLAALLALLAAIRCGDARYRAFLAVIAIALLGNALITGGLSGPHDRYQARMAALIVVAGGLALVLLTARRGVRSGVAGGRVDGKAAVAI